MYSDGILCAKEECKSKIYVRRAALAARECTQLNEHSIEEAARTETAKKLTPQHAKGRRRTAAACGTCPTDASSSAGGPSPSSSPSFGHASPPESRPARASSATRRAARARTRTWMHTTARFAAARPAPCKMQTSFGGRFGLARALQARSRSMGRSTGQIEKL